ncbi:M16 family metallopeptidase, partial [Escherichia coli]
MTAVLPHQKGREIYLVDRPDSVQSRIKMGNIGIKKTDPDFYALTVANQVLGGAATSRLFINIRENKGYTYGAYSRISPQREPGSFSAEAEV